MKKVDDCICSETIATGLKGKAEMDDADSDADTHTNNFIDDE